MVRASEAAVAAMCSAIPAVLLAEFLDQLSGSGNTRMSTQEPTLHGAVQVVVVLPLAETAIVAFFAAAVCVFCHLRHAAAGRNRRLSELVTFTLFASAGILDYVFFVQPPQGVVIDVGALGLAAARALPAAAAVTFFLGMALVLVQVRAGGGGRGGAVAGEEPVQGPVWILSNMALGAAAVVVGMMAMAALYTAY